MLEHQIYWVESLFPFS